MTRRLVIALVTALALVALAAPAAAKEGAVTKLDSQPKDWISGMTYAVGYTIRMDGVEPYKADTTEIVATSPQGKELRFRGVPEGAAGHYVAQVNFPTSGTWTWKVTQGSFFAPYELGTVTILSAATGVKDNATTTAAASAPDALPFAAAGAMLALLVGALALQRRKVVAIHTA